MALRALIVRIFKRDQGPSLSLAARVDCFREILCANNAALGTITEIQETMAEERALSAADVRRLVTSVTVQTYRMVHNLSRMTGSRYAKIVPRFDEIKGWLSQRLESRPFLGSMSHVMPLAEVDAAASEVVGQKSAFLGAARRILGGQIPDGFSTTVQAYRAFMEAGGLERTIEQMTESVDLTDLPACFSLSSRITSLIESAAVPSEIVRAIERAVAAVPGGPSARFAVRSSALQEGGLSLSFAGQYRSLLNVPPEGIVDAFKQVIASKYSPQAMAYWRGRGFDDHEVAMCCCIVRMVDVVSAGVLYSACKTGTGTVTLVQAVRGLGLSAVDGSAQPDSYVVDRKRRRVLDTKLGLQTSMFTSARSEGTDKVSLPDGARGRILADGQAVAVSALAWRLEAALKTSVDMEWAIAGDGRIFVLQVRPQPEHAEEVVPEKLERVLGAEVLLEGGSRVSGGAGSGPVCVIDSDLDMLRCPRGAVIVTHDASPRLAVLLPRAKAIVADMGEVTGHLATVARELKIPALFATRSATTRLVPAAEVTVDADGQVIYAGRIASLLTAPAPPSAKARNPNRELLAVVSEKIVPLTLRGRMASGYAPKRCRTIHDIIRFCHQATLEAMFDLGDKASRRDKSVRRLVSDVPMECRVFDLGGGLADGLSDGDVTIGDVRCVPMRALWKGMTDPRLCWRKVRPVSVTGFMSAVVNYNFDQDQKVRGMGEPSYVFVSADYLNLNSRIGYHFSTVDACIGDRVESNHASFRFVGGSTGIVQRSRRALLIQRVLAANGFEIDCRADLVNARIRQLPATEMVLKIEILGLLVGYVNHLDMALVSDEVLEAYARAFLAGDYGYKG
jgi:pyruvate, water dikinase